MSAPVYTARDGTCGGFDHLERRLFCKSTFADCNGVLIFKYIFQLDICLRHLRSTGNQASNYM